MIEYSNVDDAKYVDIEVAAAAVDRKARTIYEWIALEGIRVRRRPNAPVLVHLDDVLKVDGLRAQGRRRKPRPPWGRLAGKGA